MTATEPRAKIVVEGADQAAWTAALAASDLPWNGAVEIEELFRYDGWSTALMRYKDGSTWMHHVADEDVVPGDDPEDEGSHVGRRVEHRLRLADEEVAFRSLHDGGVITRDTYGIASEILVETTTWRSSGKEPTDIRTEVAPILLADVPQEDLPYECLRPGDLLRFAPLDGPDGALPEESAPVMRHPVPQQRLLVRHDGEGMNWIGRFAGQPDEFHLVATIRHDDLRVVRHRLSFAAGTEAEFAATMAARAAPTLATYALARRIQRETYLAPWTESTILMVAPLTADGLGEEGPSFADRAAHDAEWPDFAKALDPTEVPGGPAPTVDEPDAGAEAR